MLEQDFRKLKTNTVRGMLCVGKCMESGDGVGKNQSEAIKWYRMAAENGLPDAVFELARCYRFGIGVRRNRTTASKWLHKAAGQGHARAMVLLGKRCLDYDSGEYNSRKAVSLFRKAAEQGDAWGMFHLGECYINGDGVKKDIDAAYLWFYKAVVTAPEDERLYQSVQDEVFDPNLKEYREGMLKEALNQGNQDMHNSTICISNQTQFEGERENDIPR